MSDTTRDLLISLASHMSYMQGQLEARHELDDPEDYYWYRESVLLRQKVADHLAAEAQQPSSSLPELRSSPPTVMEIIELSEKAEAAGLGQVDFARAVLTRWGNPAPQPAAVTGRPSNEELLKLAQQYSVVYLLGDGSACNPFQEGYDMRNDVLNFARAVLARWGNPAPQPADGEVAELVETLKGIAYWRRHGKPGEPAPTSFDIRQADRLDRAAELLQRQVVVPVAVSVRLPGAEETTEDGEVWIGDPGHDYPLADTGDYDWEPHRWVLRQIGKFDAKNNLHWLPAHALPQPEVSE